MIIRSFEHSTLKEVASIFSKPIINALTNHSHPCQVIADLVTLKEKLGDFKNKKVSWFGDFNNVTQSWIEAAAILDINFSIACPSGVSASKNTIKWLESKTNI